MTRVLFVNSGIRGMAWFSIVIRDAMKGGTGLLVTPGDPAELIGALSGLIASAEMPREFGCAGRRIVEQAGPEKYVPKLRSIVQSIAARRP